MANRKKIRRVRHIQTVSKHRKLARRQAMCRDNEQKLVLRLKLLSSGMMIPGRSKLVNNIDKLTLLPHSESGTELREKAFRKFYKLKALSYIINTVYNLIRTEKDADILIGLLKLAPIFHESKIAHSSAFEQGSDQRAVIALLNKFPSIRVRCFAMALLCECPPRMYSDEVAFFACAILTAFRNRSGKLTEVHEKWIDEDEEVNINIEPDWIDPYSYAKTGRLDSAEVHLAVRLLAILNEMPFGPFPRHLTDDTISYICRDDDVMSVVFQGIRNWTLVPEKCYHDDYIFCEFLYSILMKSQRDSDRDYLITVYEEEILMALRGFCASSIRRLLECKPQIAAIIATDDFILHRVWERIMNDCPAEECEGVLHKSARFQLPVNLLDYCIQTANSSLLQKMLGMGFMTTTIYWAINDEDDWHGRRSASDIYRDVLSARPEWKGRFREMCDKGQRMRRSQYDRSRTDMLGARIQQRVTKTALYVMEEGANLI